MWQGMGDAWTALSTMIAGIAVWGAIGFALDRAFGIAPVVMVVGVLVGNFAAVYLIYVRAVNAETMRSPAENNDGRRTQSGAQREVKAR
jgi:F0F1-type ATP synthase assembly protein I